MAANNFVQVNRNVHVSYGADAKLQDEVEIIPIGSGGEVGRSCVIVKYKGKTIMFDCGNHPAKTGLDSLPFFDSIKAEEVDLVLITHFHLDHCGALPFFINQTNFNQKMRKDGSKGRVFMTSATKAFYLMVMKDFLRVGAGAEDLVNEEWLQNTMGQVETIEYHEEKTVNSIRFQAFNAGHVLGAAMFLVEINNVRILYTGDFSRIPDRHLFGAEIPYVSPDIVIVESTNGIREMESREEREDNFTRKVHEVVARGGKCLIPVFALGRAQELLLLLEEFWEAHKELQNIPIFYASSLAHACMKLYKTFTSGMNERVKEQHAHHKNPFEFKFIQSLLDLQGDKAKTHEALHNNGPCVVLASPGMLQSGLSLQLFERWCGGKNNGIIMAGYCVDGTLAKEVLDKPREVLTPDKSKVLNLRMGTIEAISFSAHSDGRQTRDFIAALPKAKHIILVHGNAKAMDQLKNKLTQDFAERRATVYTTKNEEAIRIPFTTQRTAKIMGKLTMLHDENGAETEQNAGEVTPGVHPGDFVSGVLLSGNTNQSILIHPDDVSTFTNLSVTTVKQAMLLPLPRYVSAQQVLETLQSYFAQSSVFHDIVPKVTDNNTIDQTETGVTKIKVFFGPHRRSQK
ncbi:cleavage and polyadenylation specificity factor subunit 3 [Angomonas deanei]|uniref:Uncharacterized protein n=1 Tax=Angomonas deanei TaxID=59799 RepID=A0A7G2CA21_9TRYP|nr:cleavage and polyadenylation specificity factor subunit 3 [Angomonas deanei]CAD2214862.1 Metallo-beta-lactamase superfamily/Beta-lactamase superfamily domain/Metallo-beta-lactamase superfamily domain/Beta-Casp domain/Zn-dependent metallo-hydrolase RNA specificity domain/Pre-mRNA 3'-end-processing endonuclease polyadenylation factor C-term, putative [Angomonas deanei]|eukprot:EPY32327.1 cleavage and polyadenylation specificity factor subunit 3 [Angomonas deanei]